MYAAAALYGLGFGLFNPGLALLVADRSRSADEVPRMLSLHLALNGFGQFFTVYAQKESACFCDTAVLDMTGWAQAG
jgi:hypothetical protein